MIYPPFDLQWRQLPEVVFTFAIKVFKLSDFDHRMDRGKVIIRRGPRPLNRWQRVGNASTGKPGCVMPEHQPISSAHIAAIERPGCPDCQQNRMLLSKLEAGPSGFDRHTFECRKCGRVETALASRDPMKSARGWVAGELRPPV